jgi:hypothetical protein
VAKPDASMSLLAGGSVSNMNHLRRIIVICNGVSDINLRRFLFKQSYRTVRIRDLEDF